MSDVASLTLDNPVFRMFLGYSTVVISKTLLMSLLTARQRFKTKSFANEEDTMSKKLQPRQNEAVERVRRCHQNDLENVIPFVLLGLLYVTTGPSVYAASIHFRVFTGFRLFHMVAYLLPLPQPSRALGFMGGYVVCASLAYNIFRQAAF